MFLLNDILDRIKRPTRSGVEGALLMVAFLSYLIAPVYGEDAYCQILPWKCEVQAAAIPVEQYRVTPLTFWGSGPGGKDFPWHCDERWTSRGWQTIWHHVTMRDCAYQIGNSPWVQRTTDGAWHTVLSGRGGFSLEVRLDRHKVEGIVLGSYDPTIKEVVEGPTNLGATEGTKQ